MAGKPDAIVFELGDGLLGTYGVDAILGMRGHPPRADRRGAARPTTRLRPGAA